MFRHRLALLIISCFLGTAVCAADIQGRVVGVSDGDTFTLLTPDKTQVKVRLAEIDAPESGQPFGQKSKQSLSGLIFGKEVYVVVQTTDSYGRTVGRPYVDGLDICAEMVNNGSAWAYRQYLRDQSLLDLENDARVAKRGIWGLAETKNMPPWEWRRYGNSNDAPDGCGIKGNINAKGQRIYHVPGRSSYSATKIDEAKGERWFCSEALALTAGWRAPRN